MWRRIKSQDQKNMTKEIQIYGVGSLPQKIGRDPTAEPDSRRRGRNTELFPRETKTIWRLPYLAQGTRPSAEHAGVAAPDGFMFHPRKAGEKMRAKKKGVGGQNPGITERKTRTFHQYYINRSCCRNHKQKRGNKSTISEGWSSGMASRWCSWMVSIAGSPVWCA